MVCFYSDINTNCILSPDTLAPHGLVEASVNAHIGSSHLLHGKLADLLDSAGGPLLETPARQQQHYLGLVPSDAKTDHNHLSNITNAYSVSFVHTEVFYFCHFIVSKYSRMTILEDIESVSSFQSEIWFYLYLHLCKTHFNTEN